MPVSPARAAAFDILLRVQKEDAYAAELLHASRYAKLSHADHGLANELALGVLRWRSLLDNEIAKRSSLKLDKVDAEVLASLRLAAYQLIFLDRVPARAAVHESVELVKRAGKRSAASFVNAVLRKFAADPVQPPAPTANTTEDMADSLAHPLWLVERWIREFGFDAARQICTHDQQVPPTCIRIPDSEVERELENEGVQLAPGSLLASARRVVSGDVTRSKAFHDGRIAIQDEASQLVALLVGKGKTILDCCAAPGGKTRILAEQNPSATIIAAEIYPHRARLLRRLVPAANVQVIVSDARQLPIALLFDRVLADVPCSGTGTLARNPEIKWRLSADDLADLQSRQLSILRAAMQHVAPRGRVVYSTCSLQAEENREVVEQALSLEKSFRIVDCREELCRLGDEITWNNAESLANGPYLRTIPGVHPSEGFFAAVLEKV